MICPQCGSHMSTTTDGKYIYGHCHNCGFSTVDKKGVKIEQSSKPVKK